MFPNGWPRAALLLLRLVPGILLIYDGVVALRTGPDLQTTILQSVAIGAGTLLILGLWTPIAGALVILVEVRFVFLGTTQVRSNILLGALGAALAVLGPGIRSIDALRYGRKRLIFMIRSLLATTVEIAAADTSQRLKRMSCSRSSERGPSWARVECLAHRLF